MIANNLTGTDGKKITPSGTIANYIVNTISGETMASTYASNNSFVMFNESLGSNFPVAQTINITTSNDINNPAKLANPIKLDRLAAKITITDESKTPNFTALNDPSITGIASGSFTAVNLIGYKLINGSDKTNLQQKWHFAYQAGQALGERKNTLVNPSGISFYNPYTGFYTVAGNPTYSKKYDTAQDNFSTIANYGSALDPIYCMENNPSFSGSAGQLGTSANTTGLFFQYQVTVKDELKALAEKDKLGNTFYWYNGKYYFSLESIQDEYATIFTAPKGLSGGLPATASSLSAAIGELETALGKTSPSEKEDLISKFRTKYMIKVYTNGIMYYTYFIKDKTWKQLKDGETLNNDGKIDYVYSIMRNTIYSLNVTKLLKVGTDIPSGWNPELDPLAPIDPNETYMQVQVEVNPWISQSDDIELQ